MTAATVAKTNVDVALRSLASSIGYVARALDNERLEQRHRKDVGETIAQHTATLAALRDVTEVKARGLTPVGECESCGALSEAVWCRDCERDAEVWDER